MRTILPEKITSVEEAEKFLTDLYNNREDYHPEDDAQDIQWAHGVEVSAKECDKLNDLMEQMYALPDFDPCEILVNLYNHENSVKST